MCWGLARISGSNAVSWLRAACGQIFCFCKRQMNPLGAPWCHVMNVSNIQFNLFMAGVDIPKLPSCAELPTCSLWSDSQQSAITAGQQQSPEVHGFQVQMQFFLTCSEIPVQVFQSPRCHWGHYVLTFKPSFWSMAVTVQCLQLSPTQFAQHRLLFLSKQKRRKLPKFRGEPVKTHLTSSQLMGTVKYLC